MRQEPSKAFGHTFFAVDELVARVPVELTRHAVLRQYLFLLLDRFADRCQKRIFRLFFFVAETQIDARRMNLVFARIIQPAGEPNRRRRRRNADKLPVQSAKKPANE